MSTKEMVYAALFAAFIGVLGMIPPIPLGFIPVPITAQTLGVMLAGCFLGKRMALLSLILFLVLVAIGLPILPGGRGGISALIGPSIGFIISWPIAAFCIGFAAEKVWPKLTTWKLVLINFGFGIILVSLIGAPVMAIITNTSIWAGIVGAAAYIPGDIIKAVIAAVIAVRIKSLSPIEEKVHNT